MELNMLQYSQTRDKLHLYSHVVFLCVQLLKLMVKLHFIILGKNHIRIIHITYILVSLQTGQRISGPSSSHGSWIYNYLCNHEVVSSNLIHGEV